MRPALACPVTRNVDTLVDEFARSLVPIDIEEEMRSSYLDYSMSVIIGRALPDVRDGLKPVHRRILYAMFREGMLSNRRFTKCAGVVGEVLKKYHPHGDSAVYDALVRMAQPWNMRSPLVNGQGNFGSVDGDPAAAYRYTECKMTALAEELVSTNEIDKNTVSFTPNFDGTTVEPVVMPAAFPNLLVNGSDGIAVGMATKVPPHNLGEVIDGAIALSLDPDISIDGLMKHIPGPDFPTSGTIYGMRGVHEAYHTGRGRVVVRGHTFFEQTSTGRDVIIIDELPFQVNKARLLIEIANLVKTKRIEGISALRDESDRNGMRVVIELKRDAVREIILNQLFKHTALQSTFGVILLAIVHNRPQVLTLKEMLEHYLQHRRDVTVRRCRFELRKALDRKHLLDGYLIALDHLDEIIALIRASANVDSARQELVARFDFSVRQANAILEMQLRRLTGMERQKLLDEYAELEIEIGKLQAILASDDRLMEVIREELLLIKDKYTDPRRTTFTEASGDLSILDLIAQEDQVVTLSVNGYIKRSSQSEYAEQRRGGFGKRGMRTRDEDSVQDIFVANTHSDLLVFTGQGWVYKLPVYEVPEVGRDARGTPIVNLVPMQSGDTIRVVLGIRDFEDDCDLVFGSTRGLVKRTRLSDYANIRSNGLRAYDCADGDELLTVIKTKTDQQLMIATRSGITIRFDGSDVRNMGRVARGVRGVSLDEGDSVAAVLPLDSDPSLRLLTITENGYGKRTALDEYREQKRGGRGIIDIITDERNGRVAGVLLVHDGDRVMLITDTGRVIKTPVADIREVHRNTKGVTVMRIEDDERIVSVARVVDADEDDGPEVAPEGVEAGLVAAEDDPAAALLDDADPDADEGDEADEGDDEDFDSDSVDAQDDPDDDDDR